jgi:hypothetical protein
MPTLAVAKVPAGEARMKIQPYRIVNVVSLITIIVLAGCNITINPVSTGALHTDRVDVPRPASSAQGYVVELDPGAASVSVNTGGSELVNGTVEYNVDQWKPSVVTSDNRSVISQKDFNGIPPVNSVNRWALNFGEGVPMTLTVNAGAVHGEWELGGLSLRAIHWKQGAADTTLRFSRPNPEQMNDFSIDTGASNLSVEGLSNLNVAEGRINIGAGTLLLRFNGTLSRDLTINLEGGAAAVTIDPGANAVQVVMEKKLATVAGGQWSQYEDTYNSPAWDAASGHKVTVKVNMGAASVNLVSGE